MENQVLYIQNYKPKSYLQFNNSTTHFRTIRFEAGRIGAEVPPPPERSAAFGAFLLGDFQEGDERLARIWAPFNGPTTNSTGLTGVTRSTRTPTLRGPPTTCSRPVALIGPQGEGRQRHGPQYERLLLLNLRLRRLGLPQDAFVASNDDDEF